MPNKKKKGNRKKGSATASAPSAAAIATSSDSPLADKRKELLETILLENGATMAESLSLERAQALTELYELPDRSFDEYPTSKKEASLHSKVVALFNKGIALVDEPSPATHNVTKWDIGVETFLQAIDLALREAPDIYTKTLGTDQQWIIAKCCLSIGQCRGKSLDAKRHVAWAKAAVAVDPTYYNTHNTLSAGLMYAFQLKEAHEVFQTSQSMHDFAPTPATIEKGRRLGILAASTNNYKDTASKQVLKTMIGDRRGISMRYYIEAGTSQKSRSCASCGWPGDNKCARCKTVYYCSRICQQMHWKEHKISCILPAQSNGTSDFESAPKPNYPIGEQCTDHVWNFFKKNSPGQPMLVLAANQCHQGAIKRALMEGGKVNEVCMHAYPVHYLALRKEPDNAVEGMKAMLDHGACPNVTRFGDNKHLISLCNERAAWIDDAQPSFENNLFRMALSREQLEQVERQESKDLVEMITAAIKKHSMCSCCRAKKARSSQPNYSQLKKDYF